MDTCTATAWGCFWTYFTHFLRADGDSGPGVDSRPALPSSCRATLGSTVDTCIASVSRVFWKNFHIYVLVNSYPEVDFRPAHGFRATVSCDFWKNFHTFYVLVTSYPEVDFVLLSVVATPVDISQVQFLDQLFMPVEVPTPVEFATGAVLVQGLHGRCCVWCRWSNSAENGGDSTGAVLGQGEHARFYFSGAESQTAQKTVEIPQVQFPGQSRQLQFLDKVVDVPILCTTGACGDPDSVSRTRMLTCPLLRTTGAQIQLDRFQQFQLVF